MKANDIARLLARSIDSLVSDLLPVGKREGHEWFVGSVAGEPGHSLGVHLTGTKAGVWSDFATGDSGDALDLVRAVLDVDTAEALRWSRRWLSLDEGAADLPARPAFIPTEQPPPDDPDRWRWSWNKAHPIAGTQAATYLAARGLEFHDPHGRVLRFARRRLRKNEADELEYHPALLAALSDVHYWVGWLASQREHGSPAHRTGLDSLSGSSAIAGFCPHGSHRAALPQWAL